MSSGKNAHISLELSCSIVFIDKGCNTFLFDLNCEDIKLKVGLV